MTLRDEINEEMSKREKEMIKASARAVVEYEESQKEEQTKIEDKLYLLGKAMEKLEADDYKVDIGAKQVIVSIKNKDGKNFECKFKLEEETESYEDKNGDTKTAYNYLCLGTPTLSCSSAVSSIDTSVTSDTWA